MINGQQMKSLASQFLETRPTLLITSQDRQNESRDHALIRPGRRMEGRFCHFQVFSLILVLPIILHLCNFVTLNICLFCMLCRELGFISSLEVKLSQFLSRHTNMIPMKYRETYKKRKNACISQERNTYLNLQKRLNLSASYVITLARHNELNIIYLDTKATLHCPAS